MVRDEMIEIFIECAEQDDIHDKLNVSGEEFDAFHKFVIKGFVTSLFSSTRSDPSDANALESITEVVGGAFLAGLQVGLEIHKRNNSQIIP